MKKTIKRIVSVSRQAIEEILGGRLMLGYVFATVCYYVLLFFSNLLGSSDLISALALLLAYGFITAESVMLYQRKESRNAKQLSIFCLIGMIVMLLLFLFLGATVLTLRMEYSAGTEEILQLWAETDMDQGMPYMIMTVVDVGLIALSLFFNWKALGMTADLMEHKGGSRNWYLPAAILWIIRAAFSLVTMLLQPDDWTSIAMNTVALARMICLALLFWQGSREIAKHV